MRPWPSTGSRYAARRDVASPSRPAAAQRMGIHCWGSKGANTSHNSAWWWGWLGWTGHHVSVGEAWALSISSFPKFRFNPGLVPSNYSCKFPLVFRIGSKSAVVILICCSGLSSPWWRSCQTLMIMPEMAMGSTRGRLGGRGTTGSWRRGLQVCSRGTRSRRCVASVVGRSSSCRWV